MEIFIHKENIARYRQLIAAAEREPNRDETRYQILLRLLVDEEAKLEQAFTARRRSG